MVSDISRMEAASEHVDLVVERALMALRAAADGRCVTLFIDPILDDPLRSSKHFPDDSSHVIRLPRIHADIDSSRSPYLVHLSDEIAAERLINESIRLAVQEATGGMGPDYHGRSMCAWICGDSDPRSLAHRLASLARVFNPAGRPWPLRYWDPRVIWHLPRALAADKWQALKRGIGNWWALGPALRLECFGQPTAAASAAVEGQQAVQSSMRFDAAEWNVLERIEVINKVFGISMDWGVLPSVERAAQIDRLLLRCVEWGYGTERDKLVFAACALTSHLSFDQHPQVAEALREGVAQGSALQAALAGFDDDFWNEVSRGTWVSQRFADLRTG